jgi:heme-degrading monooxygenase HmoA
MHARVTTWQVRPDDHDQLVAEVAPHLAELAQQPGYIAGYEVRPAPDRFLTITFWESAAQHDAGFAKVVPVVSEIMEGRAELVERLQGPANELA